MTQAEYIRFYNQARKSLPTLSTETMKQIHAVYIEAGKLAAQAVRAAELSGAADITLESWEAIEKQLAIGAQDIMASIDKGVHGAVQTSTEYTSNINVKYVYDVMKKAGADGIITQAGIANIYQAVNHDVIASIVNRIYQDGYSFSTRVWRAGLSYQQSIRNVISVGLSQGRDVIKIARDLQTYIADGKMALASRFGANMVIIRDGAKRIDWKAYLEKYGKEATVKAKAFMSRIGNKVDWRALRLVRSELYASLQGAAILQGRKNPAALDQYDWLLEKGRSHWNCGCPDIASGSPYKYENVPGYPHANCRCYIRPVLRNSTEFHDDLKKWLDNETVPYLDTWYAENSFLLSA
ncbi:MAG TPA: hypothetical protein VMW95_04020 [Desulfobacterales bacterium]|nr:hypothetical protein [Desulfobacterales bacterium]